MEHVSVTSAFKFGVRTFFKNILFFIGVSCVSFLVWFAGVLASALVALPCFIPLYRVFSKISEAVSKLFAEIGAAKEAVVKAGTPAAIATTETVDTFKDVLSKIWGAVSNLVTKFPQVLVFSVLGVAVFLFALWLVQMMLSVGWCKISLDFQDKGESSISTLFVGLGLAFKGMWITILSGFILILPWIVTFFFFKLHLILGVLAVSVSVFLTIYFILKLAYSFYFLADKECGAIAAIKKSFNLVGGPSRMILFTLLMIGVGLAAGIAMIPVMLFWGGILSVLRLAFLAPLLNIFIQFAFSWFSVLGVGYLYRGLERQQRQY